MKYEELCKAFKNFQFFTIASNLALSRRQRNSRHLSILYDCFWREYDTITIEIAAILSILYDCFNHKVDHGLEDRERVHFQFFTIASGAGLSTVLP